MIIMENINRFHCGNTNVIVFFLLFLLSAGIQSCAGVPKRVQNAFLFCHSNKETGIDSLIHVDGYYTIPRGVVSSFLFYRNGLFKEHLPVKYDSTNNQYAISLGLKEIVENTNKENTQWFYDGIWGNYIICNDTIKVQYIGKPVTLSSSYEGEVWFKVMDKNTLILINSMPLSSDKSDWLNHEPYDPIGTRNVKYPAVFTSFPVKPNPDKAWILKEKWFWCNERDWKYYTKKLK